MAIINKLKPFTTNLDRHEESQLTNHIETKITVHILQTSSPKFLMIPTIKTTVLPAASQHIPLVQPQDQQLDAKLAAVLAVAFSWRRAQVASLRKRSVMGGEWL